MSTRNWVPRADGEGGIGTSVKAWLTGWFKTINIAAETVWKHISTPSNPASGYIKLYVKSDNKVYKLTSGGVETELGATQIASGVTFTPNGDISATDVQAAIQEVRDDTDTKLSSKVPTSRTVNGYALTADVTVTKSDIGLGSVTNDAQIPLSYLDVDGTLAANSDTKVASQKAVKTYADQLIATANAVVYKGTTDCSANPNYPAADAGWLYIVSVAGKIGGASGTVVEAGDLFICNTDGTASGNQATVGTFWNVIEKNDTGVVSGPASAVDGNLASYNGTTGKSIQDSGLSTTNTSDAITKRHTQNTDTGTTQTSFQLDSGNTGPRAKNSSGRYQIRNSADNAYSGLDALNLGDGSNNAVVGNIITRTLNFIIDGGGTIIQTGVAGDMVVDFPCTILQAELLGDQSGSIVVDIFKTTYSSFDGGSTHPVSGDKITASAPPTISSATKSQDSTLTGWTTSISAGDILRFNVNSVTTLTRCTVSLKVRIS